MQMSHFESFHLVKRKKKSFIYFSAIKNKIRSLWKGRGVTGLTEILTSLTNI